MNRPSHGWTTGRAIGTFLLYLVLTLVFNVVLEVALGTTRVSGRANLLALIAIAPVVLWFGRVREPKAPEK
jgi:hypothetical protein